MPDNITVYKFLFTAEIGNLRLKANINSPVVVIWKRSSESVSTTPIQMQVGNATIEQAIKLPVNMYFDPGTKKFQNKKSMFSITMSTPKGEKQAGIIYVDLATIVNQKHQFIEDDFKLEKCPVKDSTLHIKIWGECLGEKGGSQTMSQVSTVINNSIVTLSNPAEQKQLHELQQEVAKLTDHNKKLQQELATLKQNTKGGLAQQLVKSKNIQKKLQDELHSVRVQSKSHEKELEQMRIKMEQVYQLLYTNLGNIC